MAEHSLVGFGRKKSKKKGKFRKNSCISPELGLEDLNYLLENTSFTQQEIVEWHK